MADSQCRSGALRRVLASAALFDLSYARGLSMGQQQKEPSEHDRHREQQCPYRGAAKPLQRRCLSHSHSSATPRAENSAWRSVRAVCTYAALIAEVCTRGLHLGLNHLRDAGPSRECACMHYPTLWSYHRSLFCHTTSTPATSSVMPPARVGYRCSARVGRHACASATQACQDRPPPEHRASPVYRGRPGFRVLPEHPGLRRSAPAGTCTPIDIAR